jgi:hypothetical protein
MPDLFVPYFGETDFGGMCFRTSVLEAAPTHTNQMVGLAEANPSEQGLAHL